MNQNIHQISISQAYTYYLYNIKLFYRLQFQITNYGTLVVFIVICRFQIVISL